MRYNHISVAIPLLAEWENLPELVDSLKHQTLSNFSVYCCVNNPEGWADSDNGDERAMYLNNQESLEYLKDSGFTVIDRSSPGQGWTGKQRGVGWPARCSSIPSPRIATTTNWLSASMLIRRST